jgi:AcrR family transcriptional regulator
LGAARAEFATAGYSEASIRQIARQARVDPALVYHYFKDKPGLFVACLDLPADPRAVQMQVQQDPPSGELIVEGFLAQWERGEGEPGESFVTLTQAVSSAPEVARAVREFLSERVTANRPGATGVGALKARALVSAQLLGVAWARYVVRMEPIASASRAEVAAWVGPTIERYLAHQPGTDPARDRYKTSTGPPRRTRGRSD